MNSQDEKKISLIIPVYRNQGTIQPTYRQIAQVFSSLLWSYEIIFIDDGSDDASLNEILTLQAADPKIVKVISFTRNFGQLAAMLAGFKKATGDAIINLSADLQDPIELIADMLQHWQQGAEIVICHRIKRHDNFLAKFFSRLAHGLLRLSLPSLPPGGFDYVLIDRKAMDIFNSIDARNRFFQGDLLWTGFRTSFIPYIRRERKIGKSQYNFWKKCKVFIDHFLDASYLPIRAISALGISTSLAGFFYGIAVAISRFKHQTPFTGYAPLMIVLLFIGGLILLMLGIVGEYIWRIYDEIRKKPHYIIRSESL